jgi:phage repressor protein C with HTH and peptisase S24 domain
MLTHKQIWSAIDGLADRHDLSASGLAKLAGLDPTTFNKSKRIAANGKDKKAFEAKLDSYMGIPQ